MAASDWFREIEELSQDDELVNMPVNVEFGLRALRWRKQAIFCSGRTIAGMRIQVLSDTCRGLMRTVRCRMTASPPHFLVFEGLRDQMIAPRFVDEAATMLASNGWRSTSS
jgi:hypothetical protein